MSEKSESRYDVSLLKGILEKHYKDVYEYYKKKGRGGAVVEKEREKHLELSMIDEMQKKADKSDRIEEYYRSMVAGSNKGGLTLREVQKFAMFVEDVLTEKEKVEKDQGD